MVGPAANRRPPAGREHPVTGILSLIFGIAGIVFVLPVVGPLLALGFGYAARRDVEREPDRYVDDLGRIGRILGWVALALTAFAGLLLALAIWLVLDIGTFTPDGTVALRLPAVI
ncbi:DUF4190 domain-containing protein [Egibacter rhizosphaerae]|uniref:DUF4190 domain-containing protein n=1 Tax=Egibacter rhizosphaerae TaxID=1670831 RepID=UPI0013F1682F|nr:DUF4190 domain-containing protein [Egibacter rhizosphaerae]